MKVAWNERITTGKETEKTFKNKKKILYLHRHGINEHLLLEKLIELNA